MLKAAPPLGPQGDSGQLSPVLPPKYPVSQKHCSIPLPFSHNDVSQEPRGESRNLSTKPAYTMLFLTHSLR